MTKLGFIFLSLVFMSTKAWGWIIGVAAVVVIAVALMSRPATPYQPAPSPEAKAPQEPSSVKLGVVIPLTGDAAAIGLPLQHALQLAVDEINAKGGVAGKPIEVYFEDGKCDGKEATGAISKLISINKVSFVFGGACSSEMLAMAPIAEAAKVIVMSPSATNPDITTAGDYIFRTAPSDATAGKIAALYAVNEMKAKKAAVISEQTDYAQGLRGVFKIFFTQNAGEIVSDEVYASKDTDFRAQITKVKAAKPDVIYILPQTPATGVLLVKQLKQAGVTTPLLTAEAILGRDVIAQNKADLEGLVGIEQYFNAAAPKTAEFIAAYKQKYNEELAFPAYQVNMYSQAYLLKEAIEKVGFSTDAVKTFLYGVKNWEHALGSLSFDVNGDPLTDYAIQKVKDGKLEQVQIFKPQ